MEHFSLHLVSNIVLGVFLLCATPLRARRVRQPAASHPGALKWLSANVFGCAVGTSAAFYLGLYVIAPHTPGFLVLAVGSIAWAAMALRSPLDRYLELDEAEKAYRKRAIINTTGVVAVYIAVVSLLWALAPEAAAYVAQLVLGFGLIAWNVRRFLKLDRDIRDTELAGT